jgi:hypothetical protein
MQIEATAHPTTYNNRHWRVHLKAWRESGLSGAEYCRQHDLSYYAFTYWKKKAGRRQSPVQFAPVPALRIAEAAGRQHTAGLKVELGPDLKIEVHDDFSPATLSRLIETLKRI